MMYTFCQMYIVFKDLHKNIRSINSKNDDRVQHRVFAHSRFPYRRELWRGNYRIARQHAKSGSVGAPEIDLSRPRASRRGASPSNLVASIGFLRGRGDFGIRTSRGTDRFDRENRMVHEGMLLHERRNDRPARSGPSFNWKLHKVVVYMTIEPADV